MTALMWIVFTGLVLTLIVIDLGVLHREARVPTVREAVGWTLMWIGLALLLNVAVYFLYENNYPWASLPTEHLSGAQAAHQFLLGYVLEKSLSLDNVFVIAMIFAYFGIPNQYQHRVLFWGILGAIVLRGVMILLGMTLFQHFSWISYAFGFLLFYTAVRMMLLRHETVEPGNNGLVRLARRWLPVTGSIDGGRFLVRIDGRWVATPLLLTLLMVESSDLVFALDSIPAVFAVTQDSFIVFSSNVMAILGLRSLYFVLAIYMQRFRYLKHALVFVLAYVGVKISLHHHVHFPEIATMAIILGMLGVGVLASLVGSKNDPVSLKSPLKTGSVG